MKTLHSIPITPEQSDILTEAKKVLIQIVEAFAKVNPDEYPRFSLCATTSTSYSGPSPWPENGEVEWRCGCSSTLMTREGKTIQEALDKMIATTDLDKKKYRLSEMQREEKHLKQQIRKLEKR